MVSNICLYHLSRIIRVAQKGTSNRVQWPVTNTMNIDIITLLQNEVQNLQLSISLIKSLGAWTCIHSSHFHFAIRESTKAVTIDITATQHTKSTIRIIPALALFPQTSMRNKGASYIGYSLRVLTILYSILLCKAYSHDRHSPLSHISCL